MRRIVLMNKDVGGYIPAMKSKYDFLKKDKNIFGLWIELKNSSKFPRVRLLADRKVRAYQVPPAELESLLLSHELTEDAAVIGIPDEYSGEVPKAFIVLKPGIKGNQVLAKEIQTFVEERKAKYKWLRGGIEFLESIPKTPSGKILRKDLRLKEKDK